MQPVQPNVSKVSRAYIDNSDASRIEAKVKDAKGGPFLNFIEPALATFRDKCRRRTDARNQI
jgi:hypothetical protein